MSIKPRIVTVFGVLLTILTLMPHQAPAADSPGSWPTRTVKIIVPFPAGAANDTAARLYADGLSRRWSFPVIIDNKPGADAIVGGGAFASAGDDHTLLYGTASMVTVNPLLQSGLPYDPVLDMVPIAPGASSILVIAVANNVPAQSLQGLMELARSKPGQLSWGSGPSLPYFAFAAGLKRHRLDMLHIPYRDAATPQADLSEGRLHVWSNALQSLAGPVAAGKARILAVTSPQREAALPDVPTVAEAGFPEMEIEGLSGLFGWRNMPVEHRYRISTDMQAVASDSNLRARLQASGQRVITGTPEDFTTAIERQRIRVQQIMRLVDPKSAIK
jgi:tripartite-type tricarboxylate transporter receptor subunit TctC